MLILKGIGVVLFAVGVLCMLFSYDYRLSLEKASLLMAGGGFCAAVGLILMAVAWSGLPLVWL